MTSRARKGAYLVVLVAVFLVVGNRQPAHAQTPPADTSVEAPATPSVETPAVPSAGGSTTGAAGPSTPSSPSSDATVTLDLPGAGEPSQSVLIIVLLTLLSVAPALLILLTSFTRIAIVLTLTRNALGLQGVPPNQVIVGLAMFLSFFVMGPTLTKINDTALQPMLHGDIEQSEAYDRATGPVRDFMLAQVGDQELELFVAESTDQRPATRDDVPMSALVPAFILSEIRTAFLIGFVVFVPFLVIDLIVSSSLMSMGMMMLPPVLVSLPFKLLLFVLVDGWGLVVRSLLESF